MLKDLQQHLAQKKFRLNDVQKKILDARQLGLAISQEDEVTTKFWINEIMLSGAALSGCQLPTTDFFADKIVEEMKISFLDFGYSEYTFREILLAMRLNTKIGIKYPSGDVIEPVTFVGNCFNIAFLSRILYNYSVLRNNLDSIIFNFLDGY